MALAAETRGRLALAVFAAPMFRYGGVHLAIACCPAGTVGSLTRNHCRDLAALVAMREAEGMALADALAHEAAHHPGHAPDRHARIDRFARR